MFEKIIANLKIASLNKMQLAALEAAKDPGDILLLSPTGSGKTLGFLLPLLNALDPYNKGIQALIVVPSRELAIQIEQVFKQMGTGFKINCCYGGHSTKIEKNNLAHPPTVLVGTPGRLAYHIEHKNIETESITALVLDEFDKSLEFGFKEEMSFIIGSLKNLNRRILTSATAMTEIPAFTGVKNLRELNFLNNAAAKASGLKLKYLRSGDSDKTKILVALICKLQNKPALVFCNHRDAVERISVVLKEHGLEHGVFHGGMEQEDRERALLKFRNGSHRLLITTDLASRGLDIPEIEAVIHYQLPATEDVYTHRNGRTARMHATGTAYLLLAGTDYFPSFITKEPEHEVLPEKLVSPPKPMWSTLYIAAGKKDKISKMDIVGMLLQKGKLAKEELGLIEVLDHTSYVAVASAKIRTVIEHIRNEKIKNRKIRIEISQ
ncbi:MAG: DEAD/DEAH box helicase [Bacteroidia bacterium]